jgi:hypothetical protein
MILIHTVIQTLIPAIVLVVSHKAYPVIAIAIAVEVLIDA